VRSRQGHAIVRTDIVAASGLIAALSAPAAAWSETAVDEVIVTGTRLPQASLVAGGPAVSVERADLARAGVSTLESYLNTLPQVVPSFGAAANNPSAGGAAFIDLRGLGESRNLVLLDGRRMVGANSAGAVDLNAIPPGLVERIEVTTGGASAVYGADAVAGVVNIILRRRQDGVELSGRTTVSERGDARQHEIDLTLGHSFARGWVLAAAGWLDRQELGKGARPFSSQAQNASSFFPGGAYVTAGPNLPSQAAVDALFAGYGAGTGPVPRNGGFGGFGFNGDGSLFSSGFPNSPVDVRNYRGPQEDLAGALFPDVYAYNFEPFNKLILPLERRTAALIGGFDLNERVSLYGQGLYARYTAETSLAPTPAPTDTNPLFPGLVVPLFVVPVTHPLIPADLARLLASRTGDTPPIPGAGPNEDFLYKLRTVAFGPRETANRTETRHVVAGARIQLPGDWDADVYGAWGRYVRREAQDGLLSVVRMQQLLRSPTAGRDLCDGGFDPFGVRLGAACVDYLRTRATNRTRLSQANYVASASGRLFEAPAGPVFLALGAELRELRFRLTPDADVRVGEVAGFTPVLPLEGTLRYRDAFLEASLPLWAGAGAKPLFDTVVGARFSDDTDGHTARSYKAELGWRPSEDLRVRGSFQRAVRAPNVAELFAPRANDAALALDPCSSDNAGRTAQVLALCQAQARGIGFPVELLAAYRQGSSSVDAIVGGNPDLRSERADTFTLGFVWRPALRHRWIRNPTLTVDGYDIDLRGAIGAADPQVAINACYNIDGGNPAFDPAAPACLALTRTAVNFNLFGLDARQINQARIVTSGVDATAGITFDLGELWSAPALGAVDARVTASWLGRFKEQASPVRPAVETAGTISDSSSGYQSLPRWKGRADLIWRSGDLEAALAGRFTSSMEHRLRRFTATSRATGVDAAAYFDLSLRWTAHKDAELRAGVVNLLDRKPEIYFPAVDANTEPSTYDVIGRRFWVGLTLRR